MANRKLAPLTLKRKIELIDAVEKTGKLQKVIAGEFGIPANSVSTIYKKHDHNRDLYSPGLIDASKQRQRKAQHDNVEKMYRRFCVQ